VKLRRAALQALAAALIGAAVWTWAFARPASVADFLVAFVLFFIPFIALRTIVYVGGALLDDDHARQRRSGIDESSW
jgi:hypothetical protein